MPYQLYCNNELIGTSTSAPLIQDYAQQHSGSIDHLLWEYEPDSPHVTVAEYDGRTYRIEIIQFWSDSPTATNTAINFSP